MSHGDAARVAGLSEEAARFLSENEASRIPVPLSRWTAPVLRRLVGRRSAESIATARSRMSGPFEHVRVQDTPVVSIGGADQAGRDDYMMFIHGGAFAFGAAIDPIGLQLATATGLPTYSIDYQLAPEARFPSAA